MAISPLLTSVLTELLLALSAGERWQAARDFQDLTGRRWFILAGAVVVIVLTVAFILVSHGNSAKEKRSAASAFVRLCDKRGLSQRERQILMMIAGKTQLRRSESIFNLATAFDRGANQLIEESLVQWGQQQSKQLRVELSLLREKLGFRKKLTSSVGSSRKGAKPSTRQIPLNKTIELTRLKGPSPGTLECQVVENNEMELTVKLNQPIENVAGAPWRGRYYFGPTVWEFDTFEINCKGEMLSLNHTDSMRFINRRSFPRVKVNKPAFIALFPFSKTIEHGREEATEEIAGQRQGEGLTNRPAGTWRPPQFLEAVVVELAGPAMRVEIMPEPEIEIRISDKVLVVVNLTDANDEDGIKIIEDICEVRQVQPVESGYSIAVELVGLGDSDVDELIRLTNAASRRTDENGQESVPVQEEAAVTAKIARKV